MVTTDLAEIRDCVARGQLREALPRIRGEVLGDLTTSCGDRFEEWRESTSRLFFEDIDEQLSQSIGSLPPDLYAAVAMPPVGADLLPKTIHAMTHARRGEMCVKEEIPSRQPRLPFVGRKEQMNELRRAWSECENGVAQYVAVTGSPGCGKTRLVQEFQANLSAQALVFEINCYRSENRIGFATATDLARLAMPHAEKGTLLPIWMESLNEILPQTQTTSKDAPALSATLAQIRLFESIRSLLHVVAERQPILVIIEDVQWCDKSSQALLAYLQHRLRDADLFFLVTLRNTPTTFNKNAPWRLWQRVIVDELKPDDVAAAIRGSGIGNDISNTAMCEFAKLSGGNPYFLTELVRLLAHQTVDRGVEKMPLQLARQSRSFLSPLIADLPRRARHCLAALAVIGRPASLEVLQYVAPVPHPETVVAALVKGGFVITKRQKLALRHDLVRQAVYSRIPIALRRQLHARAAQAISRISDRAGEAAQHYSKAGKSDLAYQFAIDGAQIADARYATDESISLLKIAIKSKPAAAHLVRPNLIDRLQRAHRYAEARTEIDRHCSNPAVTDESTLLRMKLLDVDLAKEMGLIEGASLRRKIAVLSASIPLGDRAMSLMARRVSARSAYHDGARDAMIKMAKELNDLAEILSPSERLEAIVLAARLHATIHSARSANTLVSELLSDVNAIGEHERRLRILAMIAAIQYEAGQLRDANLTHRRMLSDIQNIGAMSLWPIAACHMHMLLVEQGEYDEAETLASTVISRASDVDAIRELVALHANRAGMQFDLGQYDQARVSSQTAVRQIRRTTSVWSELGVLGVLGLSSLELGRSSEASEMAASAQARIEQLGFRACDLSYPEMLIARVTVLHNKRDAAISRLVEAVCEYENRDVICQLRLKLELARTLKPVDRKEARRHAIEVYEKSHTIGARPIADRADSLLHRL